MYRFYLSFKFLSHHWLMTIIGSFFVGASLVILVVVMSVMDGFQKRLKDTIAGSSADLIVTPRFPADLDALAASIERHVPGVVATGPFHETVTLVQKSGEVDPLEDRLEFAQVFGVDGRREQAVNRFGTYLRRPRAGIPDLPPLPGEPPAPAGGGPDAPGDDENEARGAPTVKDLDEPFKVHDRFEEKSGTKGVIVGEGLARTLDVRVGDRIRLAAIRRRQGTGENGPRDAADYEQDWLRFAVVGIYRSGNHEKDARCLFLDAKVVEELWSPDVRRSAVRARLADPEGFAAAYGALDHAKGDIIREGAQPGVRLTIDLQTMRLQSWKDESPTLMRAIESEKSMILVIAFLIVVAGTSSIFAAQWLLVSDKVREIGILRALGAGVEGVMSIFVMNGFLMGVLGSVGGSLLGLFVVDRIDAVRDLVAVITGRDVFPSDIYLFQRIPTLVDYDAVTRYAGAALVCTLVASAIPALRAGLMDPAKALHRD